MDWSQHYPAFIDNNGSNGSSKTQDAGSISKLSQQVEIADIGCGFGGLLFALAPKMPGTLILGLEIRSSVTEYVQSKIKALRTQHSISPTDACSYDNVSCVRANTMKFLPNFFRRGQLTKIFLCFPDPHFKARKHKARIVSSTLVSEYAYVLRPQGRMYTITDVEDLHLWMVKHFQESPSFERVESEELVEDECVKCMREETEEGKKVERNGGTKFVAVFRRVEDPPWP